MSHICEEWHFEKWNCDIRNEGLFLIFFFFFQRVAVVLKPVIVFELVSSISVLTFLQVTELQGHLDSLQKVRKNFALIVFH